MIETQFPTQLNRESLKSFAAPKLPVGSPKIFAPVKNHGYAIANTDQLIYIIQTRSDHYKTVKIYISYSLSFSDRLDNYSSSEK